MKCPECRKKIEKGIKFCPHCGMDLTSDNPVHYKKGRSKMWYFLFLPLLFLVGLGIAMWVILSQQMNKEMMSLMIGYDKANSAYGTTKYDNGDITYRPNVEQISFDKDSGEIYFKNLLMVYTFTDISDEEAKKLADLVNGEIVGDISGLINAKQILVQEAEFEKLNDLADILMESEKVLYAQVDYPIQLTENAVDSNPWSEDKNTPESDRGNEENPNGKDWWAEAIGAYTAWKYSAKSSPIQIGIIDSGFDTDHIELDGKISFMPDYAVNSENDYGTLVAGLIGAMNNSEGIRGVADKADLVCVDWTPDENTNYLSSGEYTEITKQLIEHGVQVINNSWAMGEFYSKEGYTHSIFGDSNNWEFLLQHLVMQVSGAYDSYLESVETCIKRTALTCVISMVEILMNGKKNFMIVQGAGNGYEDRPQGVDAKYGGYYDAVDETIYNLLPLSKRNELSRRGITYNNIDERIMIVGAVKNKTDKNGNYKMTSISNYGDHVDICAPGEDIFSLACDNKYRSEEGTSLATPLVSGSAALLWSLKPDMTPSEVKNLLRSSAVKQAAGVGDGKGSLYPMLNVGNAVKTLINQSKSLSDLQGAYEYSFNHDSVLVTALCGENGNLFCELEFEYNNYKDNEHLKFEWDGTAKQFEMFNYDQKRYMFTIELIDDQIKLSTQEGFPFDEVLLEKSNGLIHANIVLAVENYFNQYEGTRLEKSDSYEYPTEGIYGTGFGELSEVAVSENGKEKYLVSITGPESEVIGQASVYDYDNRSNAIQNGDFESLEVLEKFDIFDYFDFR